MAEPGSVIDVVLPAFGRESAVACVRFLREHPVAGTEFRFVVVDNGNALPLAERLAALAGPDCEVLRLPENLGGAGAFRAGMIRALELGGDFVWLLDDDAELNPETLPGLLGEYIRLERLGVRVGAVGSVQLGQAQREFITEAGGRLSPLTGRYLRGHTGERLPERPWTEEVGYLPATSLLARAEVVADVGPFEPIFIHCDDIDWGYRARAKGWHLFVTSHSVVYHPEWSTKPQTWVVYYDVRNLLWCLKRHLPFAARVARMLRLFQMLLYRLYGRRSLVRLMRLGLAHADSGALLMRSDLPGDPAWLAPEKVFVKGVPLVIMAHGASPEIWRKRLDGSPMTFLACGLCQGPRLPWILLRQFAVQVRLLFGWRATVLVDCVCTKRWPFPLFARNRVFYWETAQGPRFFRESSE